MKHDTSPKILGRTFGEWVYSLPIFSLLLLTLIIGTGEMVHGQLLKLGESMFGDPAKSVQYFMLRADPTRPDCNPNPDIEAEIRREMEGGAGKSGDDIDALFGDEKKDPEILRQSKTAAAEICKAKFDLYERIEAHLSPEVKLYRTIETSFFALFNLGTENRPFILLLMVGLATIVTTLGHHHISIRPARYVKDYKLQFVFLAAASAFLLYSCVRYFQIVSASGTEVVGPILHYCWMALFGALLLINVKRIFVPPKDLPAEGEGSWGKAFLAVPLFAYMAINGSVYFLSHGHPSGPAIYMNQLLELPTIFMNVALFIWAGMLLKQSRAVDLFMNILRPWRFSPELLTYIVLLFASVITAYTGASGSFLIAAGAIVYHEIRAVGGTRQFALASTAMSGSLGVVLTPCLLVVIITALNKEVTSSQLYDWGFWVFILTSTLFFIASQMHRRQRASIEAFGVAIPAMLRNMVPALPYVILAAAVIIFYDKVLETKLNEITAPILVPVMMLIIVVFEKLRNRGHAPDVERPEYATGRKHTVEESIRAATNETIGHIGALLILFTMSMTAGGVIERSEIVGLFPAIFESPWHAMLFLMLVMIFIGMFLDAFGSVILVSSTLAPVAYANGIDPVHFWMMVLVAFELGFLLPPVAINQLLTRQVVGEKEFDLAAEDSRGKNFYWRYERWLLPLAVMTVGLVIIAFGPLAVKTYPALAPIAGWFN